LPKAQPEVFIMLHVTPPLLESPISVAANCCFPPDATVAVVGARVIATEGTVIVAEADFVGSLTEVAVSVTFRLLAGGVGGAAYVVNIPEVGETAPHEAAEQVRVQFTPALFGSPCTSALNPNVAPACTIAVPGSDTLITARGRPLPHPVRLTARITANSIPESDIRFFDFIASLPYPLRELL
jgi:hypothetical protein